jgi:hypothetical protein
MLWLGIWKIARNGATIKVFRLIYFYCVGSEIICRGLPSVSALAVFFLALWRSLQIVPLETPILCPASSCDSPSRSTSLKASSSALSMKIDPRFPGGFGVKPVIGGVIPSVTGFGNLPLLPRLRLRPCRHISFPLFYFMYVSAELLYISVHIPIIVKRA